MTTVIAVAGQKGGVGKSALSRLLAVEAIRAGLTARIMDLDPAQGTTSKWALRRDAQEIEPEVEARSCRTVDAAMKHAAGADVAIFDGPAFADRTTLLMAKAAALTVLPTGFGVDDLAPQIEAAYALEARGIAREQLALVFCRARGSGEEHAAATSYVRATGLHVVPGFLREMPSIRQAHNNGRAASETTFESINVEARALAVELLTLAGVHIHTQEAAQ